MFPPPEFLIPEILSPGYWGTRGTAEVERWVLLWVQWREGWPPPPGPSGTATSAKGCTVQRGGGGGSCGAWGRLRRAAGSAQRRRRPPSFPSRQPRYRVRGWAAGGKFPPGKCTLAVEKGVSRKLVSRRCLSSSVRVLGGGGLGPQRADQARGTNAITSFMWRYLLYFQRNL